MANAKGDKVDASDFNALFTQLNKIRKEHYARPDVTASNLKSTWTGPAVEGGFPKGGSSGDVANLKNKLATLEAGVNNISGFSSKITIPSVGALLQASTISTIQSTLNSVDNLCVNCTDNSTNSTNGTHGNDGTNGTGNSVTCFSNWGSNCSWY